MLIGVRMGRMIGEVESNVTLFYNQEEGMSEEEVTQTAERLNPGWTALDIKQVGRMDIVRAQSIPEVMTDREQAIWEKSRANSPKPTNPTDPKKNW